ncbi:translation initiation factor IF-2-like [Choloepus didactylus]|uniref:translation initiation factor IF-2-like n=1 Tax=Choloepus didactylus TaxID=27675 RepID=UPI00189F556D|nr:translation initiation factor IF-2-like [Choloepus didactylus]
MGCASCGLRIISLTSGVPLCHPSTWRRVNRKYQMNELVNQGRIPEQACLNQLWRKNRPGSAERRLTSQPGTPSQHRTQISLAAAEVQGSRSSSFQRELPGSLLRRILCWGPDCFPDPPRPRLLLVWKAAAPSGREETHGHPLAPGPEAALRRGAREGAEPGGRAARRDAGTPRPGPARPALTTAARPGSRAAQAWPPPEPAGRRGQERPEPSGSLPWDTSCSALGPGRSPRLSGWLPRPPAEFPKGTPECRRLEGPIPEWRRSAGIGKTLTEGEGSRLLGAAGGCVSESCLRSPDAPPVPLRPHSRASRRHAQLAVDLGTLYPAEVMAHENSVRGGWDGCSSSGWCSPG